MRVDSFAAIEATFIERVHRAVWCAVATVNSAGRPRTRIVHTIWDGQTGWITTRSGTPKVHDLDGNPNVSLAYTSDLLHPVYAECHARWEDDQATKRHVWDLFLAAPPPLGFDPATMFKGVDDPGYGVVRFEPYRISIEDVSGQGERRIVWRAPDLLLAAGAGVAPERVVPEPV
jgi:general stress protein 26